MTICPDFKKNAGSRLKQAREKHGLKQDDLAKVVKKNLRTIVRWEAGGSSPSEGEWHLLAETLQVVPQWLITGEGPKDQGEAILLVAEMAAKAGPALPHGSTTTFPSYEPFADGETDWKLIIEAHNEVQAYIEMGEELGGQTASLRTKLPRATATVYGFLKTQGRTPSLREMNALMRDM